MNNLDRTLPKTTDSSIVPAFIALLILTSLGLVAAFTQAAPRGLTPPTSQRTQTRASLTQYSENIINFATPVLLSRTKTEVIVPFDYDTDPPVLYLTLPLSNGDSYSYLISHPQLNFLSWDKVTSGQFHLYQRQPVYDSLEDFLADSPPRSEILADAQAQVEFSDQLGDTLGLNRPVDLSDRNFIVTNFVPPIFDNDIYFFQYTLDASQASLNKNNNIIWAVRAPDASPDNPFYMGEIKVNYLQ